MKGRGHVEDLILRGRIILIYTLKEKDWRPWAGLIWLRIWTVFGLLWFRQWNFGFQKLWEISLVS